MDRIQNKLHNLHSIKRLYRKKKLNRLGNPCFCFFVLTTESKSTKAFSRKHLRKNNKEKDTNQQQKCVPFETEDHKEGLEYTMMHKHFH